MSYQLGQLLSSCTWDAQERLVQRLNRHLLAQLLCITRHTITGLLCTAGTQHQDWSADYRLYQRMDSEPLFQAVRGESLRQLPRDRAVVLAMDDTILRKKGRKIPDTAWRSDPLSPPFGINFVWAQRWLQVSMALPTGSRGAVRMVPVAMEPAPTAQRPGKNATAGQKQQYRLRQKAFNINLLAIDCLNHLRQELERPLRVLTDGRFGNGTLLKNLPAGVESICRIRADARLHEAAGEASPGSRGGRPRCYGPPLPTPEELRQDPLVPWQEVPAFAVGRFHAFKVKLLRQVKWKAAGGEQSFTLLIIAPLGYRLHAGGRLLYRKPAYLLCTQASLDAAAIVQDYLGRWDIEVNIRDEKSLLGVGEAQVRHPLSAVRVPQMAVAAYALLLLAGARAFGAEGVPSTLPPPAWRARLCPQRASTNLLLNHLRYEVLGLGLGHKGFGDFRAQAASADGGDPCAQKPPKPLLHPDHPLFHRIAA